MTGQVVPLALAATVALIVVGVVAALALARWEGQQCTCLHARHRHFGACLHCGCTWFLRARNPVPEPDADVIDFRARIEERQEAHR